MLESEPNYIVKAQISRRGLKKIIDVTGYSVRKFISLHDICSNAGYDVDLFYEYYKDVENGTV